MYFDKDKKSLFVIGMDQGLQPLIQQATKIKPENILTLQTYGPEISQPYGDLMRDIALAVYQENVEDIFVVGIKDEQQHAVNIHDVKNKIYELEGIQDKIRAIDFLFRYSIPEFSDVTFYAWLEGSKTVIEGIQKSVKFVRNHPLMPSDPRVYGLLLDKESGKLTEIQVS